MKGEPVWYLVPDGVVQYITKYALYTSAPPTSKLGPPAS
jgi:nicotinate-nucleotide adenylyltransferase